MAELLMVVIVVMMSVIVFAFYSGVFGALLTGVGIHPEEFTIVGANSPGSGGFNASAVQPTPGGNGAFKTNGTPCTGTVTANANYYVPPGASCTVNGATVQSINVNYGASLTLSGANVQAVNDNYSRSIVIANNTKVAGGMSLYGTQSFMMTNSNAASGTVTMDGVVYATYANNNLGATTNVKNSGSVQYDGNTMSGTVVFNNDQVLRFTNNIVNGTLTYIQPLPNCYAANNTVSGTITGTCGGGAPSGGLDILNTGAYTVKFDTLYLDSQPWRGISWQLVTGSTQQCGNMAIPVGPCTVWPIVIPPNTMVRLSFSWVNPTPTSPVEIVMVTVYANFLQSRVDPTAGLVCFTRSIYPPGEYRGFC